MCESACSIDVGSTEAGNDKMLMLLMLVIVLPGIQLVRLVMLGMLQLRIMPQQVMLGMRCLSWLDWCCFLFYGFLFFVRPKSKLVSPPTIQERKQDWGGNSQLPEQSDQASKIHRSINS